MNKRLIGLLIVMSMVPLLMALDNHGESESLLKVTNNTYKNTCGSLSYGISSGSIA